MSSHWDLMRRYYPSLPELPDPETTDDSWRPEGDPWDFFGPIEGLNAWGKIQPAEFRGTLLRIYKRLKYEQKRDRVRARDDERAARRFPPSNCRREGNKVLWDPPNVTGGEEPECYWVEEERLTGWTTLQPPIRPGEPLERVLYGDGDARVAAYYPNEPQRLGWGYRYGPLLQRPKKTPERMDRIVAACRTYDGPRLRRSGAPYVTRLRKHAGMPGITSAERHEAHRRATKGGSS